MICILSLLVCALDWPKDFEDLPMENKLLRLVHDESLTVQVLLFSAT